MTRLLLKKLREQLRPLEIVMPEVSIAPAPGLYTPGSNIVFLANNNAKPRVISNSTLYNLATSPETVQFVPTYEIGTRSHRNGGILSYIDYLK